MIRVVFFGTDELAIPTLRALLADASLHVVAVVTKPPAPQGRGLRLEEPPITAHVPERVTILQPTKLDAAFVEELRALHPDIAVVAVYGKIIPDAVLDIPIYKTINVHPSLLPLYRGPSPIVSAILNSDAETGVSIMQLDSEMDHGPLYAQKRIAIAPEDTTETLTEKLAVIAGPLLIRTIHAIVEDGAVPSEQDHTQATFTRKFEKSAYELNFAQPAAQVLRTVRAFPGQAWFLLPNGRRCKVYHASTDHGLSISTPGTFICERKRCLVTCIDSALILDEVVPEGKKRMSGEAFAAGYRA